MRPIITQNDFLRALRTVAKRGAYDLQLCYVPQAHEGAWALGLFHHTGHSWWDPCTVVWDAFYRPTGAAFNPSPEECAAEMCGGHPWVWWRALWAAGCEDPGFDPALRAALLRAAMVAEVVPANRCPWGTDPDFFHARRCPATMANQNTRAANPAALKRGFGLV